MPHRHRRLRQRGIRFRSRTRSRPAIGSGSRGSPGKYTDACETGRRYGPRSVSPIAMEEPPRRFSALAALCIPKRRKLMRRHPRAGFGCAVGERHPTSSRRLPPAQRNGIRAALQRGEIEPLCVLAMRSTTSELTARPVKPALEQHVRGARLPASEWPSRDQTTPETRFCIPFSMLPPRSPEARLLSKSLLNSCYPRGFLPCRFSGLVGGDDGEQM